jgi:hypothetical protein
MKWTAAHAIGSNLAQAEVSDAFKGEPLPCLLHLAQSHGTDPSIVAFSAHAAFKTAQPLLS